MFGFGKKQKLKAGLIAAVKVESAFNMLLRSTCESLEIPLDQTGPLRFSTNAACADDLDKIIKKMWETVLPVFVDNSNREIIKEMLSGIDAFDIKYAQELKEIEIEFGHSLINTALNQVKSFYIK